MFIEIAHEHGSREALVDGPVRLEHAEVLRRAATVAVRLRNKGVEPGDRVAILLPNCWQYAVAYIGAQQQPRGHGEDRCTGAQTDREAGRRP
ncbi:AMP-binding protein [Streptomyces sp. NPDC057746]|uniref:AMP-binding protein n=1 Tax=Streptomyces sp. NPDC057746 TaxID=3346237 RepID=UPI0036D10AEF